MTPEEINETYQVLAPMSEGYANANLERVGQAQSSYGPLAQAAMGGSQTAGIGNYTYNRLVRPSVDSMRDQLIVTGLSTALNKQISDSLDAARKNYERSYRNYSRGSGGGTNGGGGDDTWDGKYKEKEKQRQKKDGSDYDPNDYIESGYSFRELKNIPGVPGQWPTVVDTPTFSTTYDVYTYKKGKDEFERGKIWVEFLKGLGYTG